MPQQFGWIVPLQARLGGVHAASVMKLLLLQSFPPEAFGCDCSEYQEPCRCVLNDVQVSVHGIQFQVNGRTLTARCRPQEENR
jgi:hypothetical protein